MKKQFLFATLALATMFTACSKEEELSKNEGGTPVNFVIGGVGARTVTNLGQDGAYSTDFEKDDAVGIYASGSATATNSKFTVGEGGTSLSGTAITYTEGEQAVFTTYSPYQENGSTTVELTVGNQTTQEAFDSFDFMTDTYTLSQGNSVSFEYEHQMAMVEVTMVGTIGLTADNLSLTNIQPTLTWTVADNTVATSGTVTDIKMFKIAVNTFVAMVPAQSVSLAMFKTEIGAKIYTFTPNAAVTLNKGKIAKFTITINETSSEVTQDVSSATIQAKAWTVDTTNANIEFDEDVIDPNVILNLTSFANQTIETVSNWPTTDGLSIWKATDATLEVSSNVLSFNRNAITSTNWWNDCNLFYTKTDAVVSELYKITANVTNNGEATARLYFNAITRITVGETISNYFLGIYDSTSTKYYTSKYIQLSKGQSGDLVAYVNLGVYNTTKGDTTEATTSLTDLANLYFMLYPNSNSNTNNINFTISNLKIEKVFEVE